MTLPSFPWCLRLRAAAHWYPRPHLPASAFASGSSWRDATGPASIHSYSVLRRAPEPYALACVTLDEGVTLLTNIVDCDLDALRDRAAGAGS